MEIPKKAGLYIVSLKNDDPISVNANDPRIADKAIKVTKANCKFGKAKNLAQRKKNYEKVFGETNVSFKPLVVMEEIDEAEKAVLQMLNQHRIRGRTGRKNEWLENISSSEVERIVFETLDKHGMNSDNEQWKQAITAFLKESLRLFSNKAKLELEKWVVNRLLTVLGVDFNEDELKKASEPADVSFRNANFQVKGLLNEGRKRTLEFKEKLKQVEMASSQSELLESYTPIDISFTEVVKQSCEFAEKKATHYGPLERKTIDFVVYHNLLNYHETPPFVFTQTDSDFRSLSVVGNRYCAVVHAAVDAPEFLKQHVGKVFDKPEI